MKNRTILIFFISLFFGVNAYSDTIFCCNSDTLNLWYYYQGVLHNEECDIKMDDTLFVGSNETVYVEMEIASTIPDFIFWNKKNDICEWDTLVLENNIFEITGEGLYWGQIDNGYSGPPVTNFYVIKGDSSEINDPFILPQSYQTPSYEIKVRNDFESYQWSNGSTSNVILVDQPGIYTLQAVNYCQEFFERDFIFDEAAFSLDQFYAGKTMGENVNYVDFDPDSTSHIEDGGENSFDFDINTDGLTDITVNVSYVSAMSHTGSWLTVSPQNGCKIAVDGNNKIAARIEPGQIINEHNTFSDAETINLAVDYDNMLGSCSSGQAWNTDNYIGFSIPTPSDILYGWMEIDYNLSNGSDLTIKGYGFITDYPVNIGENNQDQFVVFPNPVTTEVFIHSDFSDYSVEILDIIGSVIYSGNETSRINVSNVPNGLYLLQVSSGDKKFLRKIIKQ